MPSAEKLTEFVAWVRQHLTGDEKGEAQLFLDRLFQAFGHGGVKEAGATLEMRVPKHDSGGTAFADLVWKPVVLCNFDEFWVYDFETDVDTRRSAGVPCFRCVAYFGRGLLAQPVRLERQNPEEAEQREIRLGDVGFPARSVRLYLN